MILPLHTGQGQSRPVEVLIGRGRASYDVARLIEDPTSLTIEDTGNQADDTASFELVDHERVVADIGPEAHVRINQAGEERFRGFIRTFEPEPFAISNRVRVEAVGVSSLLDKCIIPPGRAYVRKRVESDRARLGWLLHTFGAEFLRYGSNDFSRIQVLDEKLERQDFSSLTLRQAIEQVLAAASESANYFIDQAGRLVTWDNDNEIDEAAPYEVNTTASPSATEAVPESLRVAWDSSALINWVYVRGKTPAGSGAFSDEDSIRDHGRRQSFVDGPDSDTRRKARRLGRAALNDSKDPLIRCTFTVSDGYVSRAGVTWAPGQYVYITAPGLGWLHHRLRIIRVTTRYLSGTGVRAMDIECGALRRLFGGMDQWGIGNLVPPGYNPMVPTPYAWWDDPGAVIPTPTPVSDVGTYHIDDFARAAGGATPDLGHTLAGAPQGAPWDGDLAWESPLSQIDNIAAPLILGYTTGFANVIYSGGNTTAWLAIPDGSNVPGRHVLTWIACEPAVGLDGFMETAGFRRVGATYGQPVFYRRVDGSEGWTGTGDTRMILFDGVMPQFVASTFLLSGLYDECGPGTFDTSCYGLYSAIDDDASNDPPVVPPISFDGDAAAAFTALINDGTAITAGPSGYYGNVQDGGIGVRIRADYKNVTAAEVDPGTYTSTATGEAWTLLLRGDSDLSPGGWDSYGLDGAVFFAQEADNAADAIRVTSAGNEVFDGPWAGLMRFRVTTAGSTSAAGTRWLDIGWEAPEEAKTNVRVHLGDPLTSAGLRVTSGVRTAYIAKPIVAATWYGLRWDLRGGQVRARMWVDDTTEPATWDVTVAADPDHLSEIAAATLTIGARLGNHDASPQRLEIDHIQASITPTPGTRVTETFGGDGATTGFGLAVTPYSVIRAEVDGMIVPDVTTVTNVVTFDRAPSSGALVSITYIAGADA